MEFVISARAVNITHRFIADPDSRFNGYVIGRLDLTAAAGSPITLFPLLSRPAIGEWVIYLF